MDRIKRKPLGRNGFKYREQYGVIIICRDPAHQAKVYSALRKQGYKLRVVAV